MKHVTMLFGIASLAVLAGAASAEDDIDRLLSEGRYHEIYEVARQGDEETLAARLRDASRRVLGASMESNDSYVRWFALRASMPLREPSLAEGAREALRSGDRYAQSLALDILMNADPAGSRDEFLSALESPHRSIRLRGLLGLASLKDPELADRFIDVLSEDPDLDLRVFAVRALADTGSPQAPAGLYRAFDDRMAAVREEAVGALSRLRNPGLAAAVRRRLEEAEPEEKTRAIRLVGLTRDPDLLTDVGPYLGDGDPEIRAAAAAAILQLDRGGPGPDPEAR
jgi:HEAT repeat protein